MDNGATIAKRKLEPTENPATIEKRRRSPPATVQSDTNGSTADHVMQDAVSTTRQPREVVKSIVHVETLKGHTAGLDQCIWHPTQQHVLATSSADGTARIWSLPVREDEPPTSIVLNCHPSRSVDKSVTAIAFNVKSHPSFLVSRTDIWLVQRCSPRDRFV